MCRSESPTAACGDGCATCEKTEPRRAGGAGLRRAVTEGEGSGRRLGTGQEKPPGLLRDEAENKPQQGEDEWVAGSRIGSGRGRQEGDPRHLGNHQPLHRGNTEPPPEPVRPGGHAARLPLGRRGPPPQPRPGAYRTIGLRWPRSERIITEKPRRAPRKEPARGSEKTPDSAPCGRWPPAPASASPQAPASALCLPPARPPVHSAASPWTRLRPSPHPLPRHQAPAHPPGDLVIPSNGQSGPGPRESHPRPPPPPCLPFMTPSAGSRPLTGCPSRTSLNPASHHQVCPSPERHLVARGQVSLAEHGVPREAALM